jgi:hypothetical protein
VSSLATISSLKDQLVSLKCKRRCQNRLTLPINKYADGKNEALKYKRHSIREAESMSKKKARTKTEKQRQAEFELASFDLMLKRMVKRGVIV